MAAIRGGEINLTSKPQQHECAIPIQPEDNAPFSPSPNRPPKIPTDSGPGLTRRSTFNKPKSRFGEPSLIDSETFSTPRSDAGFNFPSPTGSQRISWTPSLAQRTPTGGSGGKGEGKDGPDEREVYRRVTAQLSARNHMRMTVKFLVQFVVFVTILSCLVCSLTVESMRGVEFYGLKLWKWFVLLMVIFSGMLITQWFVHIVVFFIEWKFLLRKNLVYFTHALKTSVEVFIWIAVVLATWVALFKSDVHHPSSKTKKFLDFVTWSLATLLIGSFAWLIKTTLLKILAASFHLNRFFDRIQDSVFHHYALQILSGRPVMAFTVPVSTSDRIDDPAVQVSFTENVKSHKKKKVIDVAKLHQMKKDKIPSYTMQLLVDVVSNSGLSTMSGMLEEDHVEGGVELDDDEITSEEQAIVTAVRIFENITFYKDEHKEYIDRRDFEKFMMEEEVDLLFPNFEPNEKGQINLRAFSKWVVFKDRQQLQHALNDNKTAVKQLNKIVTAILCVILFILWLLLTELASTKLLLFFSSQLVVAAFIFGNTCKTIFEAIIFVFVMHPFDVGDRCVVDGNMLLVEEMNILTTVMLRPDKEKVYYPNSVLATKPISNFYRSPDNQGDTVEFWIDFMTPIAKIGELKERIRMYLVGNPTIWHPDHFVVVKEIENVNKIKFAVFVNHTMNFQDYAEKLRRKSELVLEIKKIFEDLEIKCHLLPQEVFLSSVTMASVSMAMPMRVTSQNKEASLLSPLKKQNGNLGSQKSRGPSRIQVKASSSLREKAVVAATSAALTASVMVPQAAEAAQSATSLNNFLFSIIAGGVVLAAIGGAVVGVSYFDPVKRG
ncbi:hypothetical protein V2J09_010065 [Rumex salicifolius]